MGYIELKEVYSTHQYIIDHLASLPHLSVIRADHIHENIWSHETGKDLLMSVVIKDFKKKEDLHQLVILSDCAVAGMLDRFGVKATIQWPNQLIVDEEEIASVCVEYIGNDIVIVDFYIRVNSSINMSMKKKMNKNYVIKTLMISMLTYLKIYYNLYQQNSYNKILDYANDIAYYKGEKEYKGYGVVSFDQLNAQGQWCFTNKDGCHIRNIIKEEDAC